MIFWAPANMTLATTGPGEGGGSASSSPSLSLGQMLLNSVGDLLFCPDFTVMGKKKKNQPEKQEDLSHVDSCEHLWEAGIACTKSSGSTNALDTHRTELLSLLIVCFSESLYYSQEGKPLCKLMCWSITCVVCCLILQRKSQTTSGLHTSHPLEIDTYCLCSHPC